MLRWKAGANLPGLESSPARPGGVNWLFRHSGISRQDTSNANGKSSHYLQLGIYKWVFIQKWSQIFLQGVP